MIDNLSAIRDEVYKHRGSQVFYRAANGRRKAEAKQGVIVDAYPKLFTLYVESQNSTVSFSYTDLLTKEVELRLLPPEDDAQK